MRCENCGREIDNMWGFCPYCGSFTGDIEDSFMNIARMFGGKAVIKQEGDSFIVVLEIQGVRQAFRITPLDVEEVLPVDSPLDSPLDSHSAGSASEPLPEPRKNRAFEKTEEPKTETNYVKDNLYIKVDLKGVAEGDIDIDRLEDSIEIRAYKGKTRYFKLIPVPRDYHIISKEFLPGEVFIVLKKE